MRRGSYSEHLLTASLAVENHRTTRDSQIQILYHKDPKCAHIHTPGTIATTTTTSGEYRQICQAHGLMLEHEAKAISGQTALKSAQVVFFLATRTMPGLSICART